MSLEFRLLTLLLLVGAVHLSQAEDDKTAVEKTDNHIQSVQPAGQEVLARIAREAEADAKKKEKSKTRRRKKNGKKGQKKKKKSKKGKKKNGKKRSRKTKTKKSKKTKNKERKGNGRSEGRNNCDDAMLVAKIKNFVKYQNQLKKATRILRNKEKMEKKATKAASQFTDSLDNLKTMTDGGKSCGGGGKGNLTKVKPIYDKLANCSVSAKAQCDPAMVSGLDETAVKACQTKLKTWIDAFKACKTCACITALADADSSCLSYDDLDTKTVAAKGKCTGSSEEGSFGNCMSVVKELSVTASGCDDRCGGPKESMGSTSGGRRARQRFVERVFKEKLMKKNA